MYAVEIRNNSEVNELVLHCVITRRKTRQLFEWKIADIDVSHGFVVLWNDLRVTPEACIVEEHGRQPVIFGNQSLEHGVLYGPHIQADALAHHRQPLLGFWNGDTVDEDRR